MRYVIKDKGGMLEPLAGRLEEEGYTALYNTPGDISTTNTISISDQPAEGGSHIGITNTLYNLIRDKIYMYAVLKVLGLTVPPFHAPTNGQIDIKKVEEGKTYILESSSSLSYINKEVEDAIRMLQLYNKLRCTTLLREVPYALELEVEGWFNGIQLVTPSYLILNRMIMRPLPRPSKLFQESLGRVEEALKKTDYKGPVSLTVGLTKDELYGLQLGVEMRPMVFEAMKGVAKNLNVVATASKNVISMYNEWTMQTPIMVSTPMVGLPILGWSKENAKHLWLFHAVQNHDGMYYDATSPVVGYVTARGESPRECIRRVKRTMEQVYIPFSLELAFPQKVLERWKKLQGWGWA